MMKRLLLSILAVLILVEEWLWDVLMALGNKLFALLHLEFLQRWLEQSTPMVAMATFILPIALIVPLELGGVRLISHGELNFGFGLLISGKLFATFLVSRIFASTRTQLLTFAWFSVLYSTVTRWLDWAHELLRATAVYQLAVRLRRAGKAKLAEWLTAANRQ